MTEDEITKLAEIVAVGFNEVLKINSLKTSGYNEDLKPVVTALIEFINNREQK